MTSHTHTHTLSLSLSLFQASVHRQQSEEGFKHQSSFKRQFTQKQLSKLQEEWDKDTPKVSILRVMKLNAREWWIILIGE